MKNDIHLFLLKLDISTSNAVSNEQISEGLANFGITKESIIANTQLIKELLNTISEKQQQEGDKKGLTKHNRELFNKSFEKYSDFVTFARLRFNSDDSVVAALKLNGERKRGYAAHIFEGEIFYKTVLANSDILNGLLKYNIKKEDIEAGYELLKEFKETQTTVSTTKEDSKEMTKTVNDKIDSLYSFYNEYKTVAKIAFKKRPELLNLILIESL